MRLDLIVRKLRVVLQGIDRKKRRALKESKSSRYTVNVDTDSDDDGMSDSDWQSSGDDDRKRRASSMSGSSVQGESSQKSLLSYAHAGSANTRRGEIGSVSGDSVDGRDQTIESVRGPNDHMEKRSQGTSSKVLSSNQKMLSTGEKMASSGQGSEGGSKDNGGSTAANRIFKGASSSGQSKSGHHPAPLSQSSYKNESSSVDTRKT